MKNATKRRKTHSDAKENVPPTESQRKNGRQVKRRVKGALAAFVDMPLDILLCRCELLDPHDLLHLARLSKAFRRVSKSSISAWKSARSNIGGLPEPLYGLSEPAWANLIFVRVCHRSFALRDQQKSQHFFSERAYALHLILYQLSTLAIADLQRVPGSIRTDEDILLIATLIPTLPLKSGNLKIPAWREIMKKYAGPGSPAILKMSTARLNDQDQVLWQICGRMHLNAFIGSWGCWSIKPCRPKCSNKIVFEHLGYGEELASMPSVDILAKHNLVNQTRPLTDRIWTNIQGELVKYMKKVKVDRLAQEHHELLQRRRKVVIEYLSHVQSSVSEHTLPSPARLFRTPSNPKDHPPAVKRDVGGTPLSAEEKSSEVRLARNVFICKNCTLFSRNLNPRCRKNKPMYMTLLFFPDIVGHCCLSLGFDSRAEDDEIHCTATASVRVPWNTTRLEINDRAREVINALIAFIGTDPETTTVEDLDDEMEDYQFRCYACPDKKYVHNGAAPVSTFELYGWRDFLKHILAEHHEDTTPLEDYVKLVHAHTFWVDDWLILETVLDGGVFLSPHCTDLPCELYYWGYDSMVEHLRDEHELATVTDDVDIYAHGHYLLPEQRSAATTEAIDIVPEGHPLRAMMEE
ncbi:hypothetical protein IW261DRAFT_1661306 [Armillaria novae-zelandiae]|uniref:F-box domain-containing protein n=1 Tax=Armillaria novae-zelandiae TaxID=153914 RepID=A0AA39NVR2_9AGAR|nr:hypothetical protein IW261DRAFT_1661306 [Armillaria novae-zelandiae]